MKEIKTVVNGYEWINGAVGKKVDKTIQFYAGDSFVVQCHEFVDGCLPAYNREDNRKGIVFGDVFYPTVPLNDVRAGDLSLHVFGSRDTNREQWFRAGVEHTDWSHVFKDLTGFDSKNQEIVDCYRGLVTATVVEVDPTYASYILLREI